MQQPKLEEQEQRLRHIRVEQRSKTQLVNEENQNWAVSYSDMLMVLMSFFIIFFSFKDNQTEQNFVTKIAQQINKDATHVAGAAANQPSANQQDTSDSASRAQRQSIKTLAAAFQGNSMEMVEDGNHTSLTVHLKDELYGKRKFSVDSSVQEQLDKVLKIVAPYKDEVHLVFIGHADRSILTNQSVYLSNNLDLSSLRASRALTFAIAEGFDPAGLSIQAGAINDRSTRSLSIKILTRR